MVWDGSPVYGCGGDSTAYSRLKARFDEVWREKEELAHKLADKQSKINQLESEILELNVELDKHKTLSKVIPTSDKAVSVRVRNFKRMRSYDRCRIRHKTI